jgi:hypothetical protein
MSNFAQIDESNVVIQVIVVNENECLVDGVETESKGIEFCKSLFGGNWLQTSVTGYIRGKYAGIGDTYDAQLDIFIAPEIPTPSEP